MPTSPPNGVLEGLVPAGGDDRRAVRDGWAVAAHIVAARVPMWCVAAGVESPVMPPVAGFGDLGRVRETLASIDTTAALHLPPGVRAAGVVLAERSFTVPLRAVEVALGRAQYPPGDEGRLCAVWADIETVAASLAALAASRHPGDGPFDLAPWVRATTELAGTMVGMRSPNG